MEGALEGDHAEALGLAGGELVAARHLDRALHRLGAGVGEEHGVGEGRVDEPLGQPLAAGMRNRLEMCQSFFGLLGERLDQMRVRMAERVHGDAGGEIEVARAVRR